MESTRRVKGRERADALPRLQIRMLGRLSVSRGGQPVDLPSSRKVRALLGFLLLSANAVTRSQLCDLLWDVPSDPRGELRWCLSKIRRVIDEPDRDRVQTHAETVYLDMSECDIDALSVAQAMRKGPGELTTARLRELADLFAGDLLEGLEVDRNPTFQSWLVAQRRQFRDMHISLLDHLTQRLVSDAVVRIYVDRWLAVAPFDPRPHQLLLRTLAAQGQLREGDEHLEATARLFEADGLDIKPLNDVWHTLRSVPYRAVQAEPARPAPGSDPFAGEIDAPTAKARRASVAVMPFIDVSALTVPGGPADALAHDVITRLAKLRSLRVIAQGTVFAMRDELVRPEDAGRMLGVDYVVSGALRRSGKRFSISVELAETQTSNIVWAEVLEHTSEDAFLLVEDLSNRIVGTIDREVEAAERNRAILKPPNSLDAWEAHHRGLWHMYRFTKTDNDRAQHFFKMALRLDPTFARAHAGLSFTHWQNAFQGWAERDVEVERAYASAGESLMSDDRDPSAHWAMGRALWLRGVQDQSVKALECSVDLSPNFALGHYTLAFVHSQLGDASAAVAAADLSRHLSPFDPLLFGMLASRAIALIRLGRFEEAARCATMAALRPNAHSHIKAIAAMALSLAGRIEEARPLLASIQAAGAYAFSDFMAAFKLSPKDSATFRDAATQIDLR